MVVGTPLVTQFVRRRVRRSSMSKTHCGSHDFHRLISRPLHRVREKQSSLFNIQNVTLSCVIYVLGIQDRMEILCTLSVNECVSRCDSCASCYIYLKVFIFHLKREITVNSVGGYAWNLIRFSSAIKTNARGLCTRRERFLLQCDAIYVIRSQFLFILLLYCTLI